MSLVNFRASNHPQQVKRRGATERDNLGTDPALFTKLDARFHFTLDVAASSANAKCERYFDEQKNGLTSSWKGERAWCNPPYSSIESWVWKAWLECREAELIVMLLPANRTEQSWWQIFVEPFRDRERDSLRGPFRTEFIAGRQRFVLPGHENIGPNERPPFGSVILIWGEAREK